MNFSYPFIRRPIGTSLLAIGLFMAGVLAYRFLPVASLPVVEFPTISVTATRPGADPATMAATIAAPIERRLSEIAGVNELTSRSSLGVSRITIQFDLNRPIEKAARDVEAALNAAARDLPGDLPILPSFRKINPAAAPILILALTSKTLPTSAIYDIADSVLAQRFSQVEGIADVSVNGAEQPAVRVRVDPAAVAALGVSMEQIRLAITNSNAIGPLGAFDGPKRAITLDTNRQLRSPREYDPIIVKTSNGDVVRLSAIASIDEGVRNSRSVSWFNSQPSVLLVMTKEADANVIETVERVKALLPELRRWIPADLDISILNDRSATIKAGVQHMQMTLLATVALVMVVVFLFLRRTAATVAVGVTVPLSLAGTCCAMWAAGFSVDNISLMALAISVGFVVDDAIVMVENMFRNMERGLPPLRAALAGARQIGFTVVSISVSLIAAFIPLLFMGDVIGRTLREFSVTLTFAIAVSTVVSLSVTPMICAHFVRAAPGKHATWLDRAMEAVLARTLRAYARSLETALRYRRLVLAVLLGTVALTVFLYVNTPKGSVPEDDTGLIYGSTEASAVISFAAMEELQERVNAIVLADPAIAGVGSSISGGTGFNASVNRGTLFISLKPLSERGNLSSKDVINRLRPKLADMPELRVYFWPAQDVHIGGRWASSRYQFTLWDADIDELETWVPLVGERLKQLPELVDVNTDRGAGGLQANVVIDRMAASRLGVKMQDIDNALNNAFSQRQISTIYSQRNQYRVVLETDRNFQRDPSDLEKIYISGSAGQVPFSSVARIERGLAPLVINHQGQFPSVTISFDFDAGVTIAQGTHAVLQAAAEMHLPDSLHADFAGEGRAYLNSVGTQPLLIAAALIAVYIVLGVLYESLLHPLTILSTLPPAGLGALLALYGVEMDLSLIAFIGIILLIGLVKKNGIMLVDFALEGQRREGLSPERAVVDACLKRFRPILMTTMSAMLGALPLVIATGPGSDLRRPLGITIIGGLLLSQFLTLYTTPVIYVMLDTLRRRFTRRKPERSAGKPVAV